mgnify:CR=1 FL=1
MPAAHVYMVRELQHITRLAPSPTGALHLGNARTFVLNWILARRHGWKILLRIEDLDGPRVKPEAVGQVQDTLEWLGLDWDGNPTIQSDDLRPHAAAVNQLAKQGMAYPCELTRREIAEAASAPHDETEAPTPATRPERVESTEFDRIDTNWRFASPDRQVGFQDRFSGAQLTHPLRDAGDFVIWTKRGTPSYQLAVVVDDARQGVTQVVRGDDLVASTGQQMLIHAALGLGPLPAYTHLPLVIGEDGRRLAKRHGDSRIDYYREQRVPVERVYGLLASWSMPEQPKTPMDLAEFAERLDLDTMPPGPARFTPEDDAWLFGRC